MATVAFDLRNSSGALARVAGLPIVVRNAILAYRAGAREIVLIGAVQERARAHAVLAPELSRRRVDIAVRHADDDAGSGDAVRWPAALSVGRRPPVLDGRRSLGATDDPLWIEVVDEPSRRLAERRLLASLRKPEDGMVAQFDRHLSLATSRRLLPLPIGPNVISALALAVGALCGLVAAMGTPGLLLLGAALFRLNDILDGVDGEIARAKQLESRSGEWLDTLCDDFTNLSFAVGAGVGVYRQTGNTLYLVLGALAGGAVIITAAFMYHYLITKARCGDLNAYRLPHQQQAGPATPPGPFARLLMPLKALVRRDAFSTMALLLALIGQIHMMVWLLAIGGTVVWTTIAWETAAAWLRGRTLMGTERA